MKRNLIIALAFIAITANAQKLDGFFHYYKLSNAMRLAYEDYLIENNDPCTRIIVMDINNNDTTKVFFVGSNTSVLLTNPPYYFSYYKNKLILIYTGKERNYYPSKLEISNMLDFISGIEDSYDFEIVNLEKYIFRYKGFGHKKCGNSADLVEKRIYLYDLKEDTVLKKPFIDCKPKAFFERKFQPKFIK